MMPCNLISEGLISESYSHLRIMIGKQIRPLILLSMLLFASVSKAQQIILLQQGKPTNIRGLYVVNDNTAWISGSKGYVAITTNAGKTWTWQQIKGYETADFRGIKAFSDKEAIIMSSGTPALVLKTIDGGLNWKLEYKNTDTSCFMDAISFIDPKHGFILGDPVNNKFFMLETIDGGETWGNYTQNPVALPNEAAFAASNTCFRITSKNKYIATGGLFAEVDISNQNGGWAHHQIPIFKGKLSKGAFSIAINNNHLVVVGGDYQHDTNSDSTACYSTDGGYIWHLAEVPTAGYQSCVEFINASTFLSTGTSGSNITTDNGRTWRKINNVSFNVCGSSMHKKLILIAGNNGKIAIYKP
jgi:photosystem II stability/assembly factor-like uncharacterized protein